MAGDSQSMLLSQVSSNVEDVTIPWMTGMPLSLMYKRGWKRSHCSCGDALSDGQPEYSWWRLPPDGNSLQCSKSVSSKAPDFPLQKRVGFESSDSDCSAVEDMSSSEHQKHKFSDSDCSTTEDMSSSEPQKHLSSDSDCSSAEDMSSAEPRKRPRYLESSFPRQP